MNILFIHIHVKIYIFNDKTFYLKNELNRYSYVEIKYFIVKNIIFNVNMNIVKVNKINIHLQTGQFVYAHLFEGR